MAECDGAATPVRVIIRPHMAAEVTPQRGVEFHTVTPERRRDRQVRLGGSGTYVGRAYVFRKTGLVEALRRAEHRPSMRYLVGGISSR